MGDMNFRINSKSFTETVKQIKENKIEALLSRDQLLIEKEKGNIFFDCIEGPITFPPTYKFAVGRNEYDG